MAQARISQSQYDALADPLKAEYEKSGDNYVLKVEGSENLPVVADLQRNLSAAREDAKREKRALTALKSSLGDRDAESIAADLARLEELGDLDSLTTDAQVRERIANIERQLGDKIAAAEAERDQARAEGDAEIGRLLIDAEVSRILGRPEYAGSSVRLLSGPIKEQTRVVRENGRSRVEVLDADGNPRYGDGTSLMSLEQLVQTMKDDPDFAGAFGGARNSGAGSAPDSGSGRTGSSSQRYNTSGRDVVLSHEEAKDHKVYMAAKAAAEKAGGQLVVDSPWSHGSGGEGGEGASSMPQH